MLRKLKHIRQSTNRYCGPCCMMMLAYRFRKIDYPSRRLEQKLYDRCFSRALGYGVTPAAAARWFAEEKGLKVVLRHSASQLLENRGGYFAPQQFTALMEEYQKALACCGSTAVVYQGQPITAETLRTDLAAGRQLMVECIVEGGADGEHDCILHWVVVYGTEGENFLVFDPSRDGGCRTFTPQEMEDYMDTPLGRISLAVGE